MGRKTDVSKLSDEELNAKLTQEERELLALLREGKNDPVLFGEKVLDLEFHDGQKIWLYLTCSPFVATSARPRLIDLAYEAGLRIGQWKTRPQFEARIAGVDFLKNILVPSNRWGKTFNTSVKHIWFNFYKKGARGDFESIATLRCGTLNLSPHSMQAQAGYDYVVDIVLGKAVWVRPDGTSRTNKGCRIKDFYVTSMKVQRKILFKNGTSYRAVPTGEDQASSLAGTPYLYISYDECAQSMHLKAELPAKIMSRLIDFGGPLDLVSTPEVDKPSHAYFSRIAKMGLKGLEGWFTLIGKITDNIFLGRKEVDRVIASIASTDPGKVRQVAFGDFVTTGKKMFDLLLIERIFDIPQPPSVFTALVDHKYLVIADWGFADNGDPTVFYVLDYTDINRYRIAYVESILGGSPFAVSARARMLQREWNEGKFMHDSAAMGGTMMGKMLRELGMHDMIDFNSSGGNKADMLFAALVVLTDGRRTETDAEGKVIDKNPDFGRLRGYLIPELEEQLGNYQYNSDTGVSDRKLVQDHVIALSMGLWYLERKVRKTQMPSKIDFNPLAPTVQGIFPGQDRNSIRIRSIEIKEKQINL